MFSQDSAEVGCTPAGGHPNDESSRTWTVSSSREDIKVVIEGFGHVKAPTDSNTGWSMVVTCVWMGDGLLVRRVKKNSVLVRLFFDYVILPSFCRLRI